MRAQWHAFHQLSTLMIHRKSSEQLFAQMRVRQPLLAQFPTIDDLIYAQHRPGGDPMHRNRVLRALVAEAQANATRANLPATIVILTLWPGLDAVYGRLCRDFCRGSNDVCGDVIGQIGLGIQTLDLDRVNKIAATLLMNTERDIRRHHIQHRRRQQNEVPCDDEAVEHLLVSPRMEDDHISDGEWRRRLSPLIGRDTDLFLRIILLGETQSEAGRGLGLTPDAARKRHQRGMRKLRSFSVTGTGVSHPAGLIGF